MPKAGAADFDDSRWETIEPAASRRGDRPESCASTGIGPASRFPKESAPSRRAGSTVVFEIVVDDYAEIWVDGKLPRVLGQTGGALVKGFNAPNRVVLTNNARPGQTNPAGDPRRQRSAVGSAVEFHLGPIGDARLLQARRDGWAGDAAHGDPRSIRRSTRSCRATRRSRSSPKGFCSPKGRSGCRTGYLLFSDPNSNTIYRWSDADGLSVFRTKSGYTGVDIAEYGQPGSNGLTLDRDGRLTIDEHGNRRVTRLEKNGSLTVLADRYEGKRLNSPNDLVYKSDGSLYFTDPPFGLPKAFDDPRKETPYSGVYRWSDGKLQLLSH